jgi:hypothetical protein
VTVRKRDSPLDIRDRQRTRCREPEPQDVARTAYIVSDLNPLIGNARKGHVKKMGVHSQAPGPSDARTQSCNSYEGCDMKVPVECLCEQLGSAVRGIAIQHGRNHTYVGVARLLEQGMSSYIERLGTCSLTLCSINFIKLFTEIIRLLTNSNKSKMDSKRTKRVHAVHTGNARGFDATSPPEAKQTSGGASAETRAAGFARHGPSTTPAIKATFTFINSMLTLLCSLLSCFAPYPLVTLSPVLTLARTACVASTNFAVQMATAPATCFLLLSGLFSRLFGQSANAYSRNGRRASRAPGLGRATSDTAAVGRHTGNVLTHASGDVYSVFPQFQQPHLLNLLRHIRWLKHNVSNRLTRHQHGICTLVITSTVACLLVAASQTLGYSLPNLVISLLHCATVAAFALFAALCSALRPKPHLIAMIQPQQPHDSVPQVTLRGGTARTAPSTENPAASDHYLTRSMICPHEYPEMMPYIADVGSVPWVVRLDRAMSIVDIEDQLDEMYDRNLNALLDSLIPAYVVTAAQATLWDQLMAESMSPPGSPLRRPCDDSLDERFRTLVQDITRRTEAFFNHREFPYDRLDLLVSCPEYWAAYVLRDYCDEQWCLIRRDVLRWLRSHDGEPAPAALEPLPPKIVERQPPSDPLVSKLAPPFQRSAPEPHMSALDATAGGGSARQFYFSLGSDPATAPCSPHDGAHSLAADVPDAPNAGYCTEDSAAPSSLIDNTACVSVPSEPDRVNSPTGVMPSDQCPGSAQSADDANLFNDASQIEPQRTSVPQESSAANPQNFSGNPNPDPDPSPNPDHDPDSNSSPHQTNQPTVAYQPPHRRALNLSGSPPALLLPKLRTERSRRTPIAESSEAWSHSEHPNTVPDPPSPYSAAVMQAKLKHEQRSRKYARLRQRFSRSAQLSEKLSRPPPRRSSLSPIGRWADYQEAQDASTNNHKPAHLSVVGAFKIHNTKESSQHHSHSHAKHQHEHKTHEPHSRDRTHPPATSKWPVPVNPKLKPSCTPEAVGRVKNGKYVMTPEERKAFDERDRTKKSAVASLKQDDFATALRLFSAGYEQVVTPASVLADSGASLGLCISSRIAEKLGLTWTPGSAPLVGVGGTSHSESRANEAVVIRLGGDGREHDVNTTPEGGCFTVQVRPHIMSEETATSLGHDCVMGQPLLWRSLASFNQLSETMEISPAYVSSGCADFRVSIPCSMTVDRSPALVTLVMGSEDQPLISGFLPPPIGNAVKPAAPTINTTSKARPQNPNRAPGKGFAGVVLRAIQAASEAVLGLLPNTCTPHPGNSPARPDNARQALPSSGPGPTARRLEPKLCLPLRLCRLQPSPSALHKPTPEQDAPGPSSRPGALAPGTVPGSATLQGGKPAPLSKRPTGGADTKGKAKAKPPPVKTPVVPSKHSTHHNQPLRVGSSPAEATLAQAEVARKHKPTSACERTFKPQRPTNSNPMSIPIPNLLPLPIPARQAPHLLNQSLLSSRGGRLHQHPGPVFAGPAPQGTSILHPHASLELKPVRPVHQKLNYGLHGDLMGTLQSRFQTPS